MSVTKNKRILLVAVFLSVLISGCVEWVNLNTEDTREIVINCVLQNKPVQELQLVWSRNNSDSGEVVPIRDATVDLLSSTNGNWEKIGEFRCDNDGIWRCPFLPAFGNSYRIEVTAGKAMASAETTMPEEMACIFNPNPALIFPIANISLESRLFPSRIVQRKDKTDSDISFIAFFTNNNRTIPRLYTTHPDASPFNAEQEGKSFSVAIQLTENPDDIQLFNYFFPYHKQVLFVRQPSQFSASYMVRMKAPFLSSTDWEEWLATLKRIPDYGTFVKDNMLWGPNFDLWPEQESDADTLHFIFPSAELYQYLKEIIENQQQINELSFTELFRSESFYTNIRGGKGIFGAMIHQTEDYTNHQEELREQYELLRQRYEQ